MNQYLNYTEYGALVHSLTVRLIEEQKSRADWEKFQGVYGPARGGLPIAVHVSHHLGIPFLHTVPDKKGNFLIVDDICDTGDTFGTIEFRYARDDCKRFFATLFVKPNRRFNPHMFLLETEKWVVFPWEDKSKHMEK